MEDKQLWLQTWQAVCQKEAEMKIVQQRNSEKSRNLDMKMRLMDLRIETAFKIRDEYLTQLLNKYPNWKPQFVSVGLPRNVGRERAVQKTELAVAQMVDMDMLQNWDDKITLDQLVQSKMQSRNLRNNFRSVANDQEIPLQDLKHELEHVKKQLNDISVYLKDMKISNVASTLINNQQQQMKTTTVSISRKHSMKDREYSATEHIRLPKATDLHNMGTENFPEDDYVEDDDDVIPSAKPLAPVRPIANEPGRNEVKRKEAVGNRERDSTVVEPTAPGPRFNFGGAPKEPSGKIVTPPQSPPVAAAPSRPSAKRISPPAEKREMKPLTKPEAKKPPDPPTAPNPTVIAEAKRPQAFFTDPIKDAAETPESTPEVAKSTKVVQSYEALLGIITNADGSKKQIESESESESDDLEKRLKSPPSVKSADKLSSVADYALGKSPSQVQLAFQEQQKKSSATPLPNSSNFGLDFLSKPLVEKKPPNSPPKSRTASSTLLTSSVPKEAPKPAPVKNDEPLSDPDDFLAKLFPDKFGTVKKAEEKPKGVASLFGERKPNKSAFFIGDDSDSETVDIPKKKTQQDDDFDFFN